MGTFFKRKSSDAHRCEHKYIEIRHFLLFKIDDHVSSHLSQDLNKPHALASHMRCSSLFYCKYFTLGLPLLFVRLEIIVKLQSQRKLSDILWHCWINVLAGFVARIHRDEGKKRAKPKLTDHFIDAYSSSVCFPYFSVNPKGSITICTLLKTPSRSVTHISVTALRSFYNYSVSTKISHCPGFSHLLYD